MLEKKNKMNKIIFILTLVVVSIVIAFYFLFTGLEQSYDSDITYEQKPLTCTPTDEEKVQHCLSVLGKSECPIPENIVIREDDSCMEFSNGKVYCNGFLYQCP